MSSLIASRTASDLELGEIKMRSAGGSNFTLKLAQLAVDDSDINPEVYLASVIGPSSAVKAFCAVMALDGGKNGVIFETTGAAPVPSWWRLRKHPGQGQYKFYRKHLGFNTFHAVIVSKKSGFLPNAGDKAIWNLLSGPEFTTPVLPEWVDYLRGRLEDRRELVTLKCFQCECGMVTATTDGLDAIVSHGLRDGKITIPNRKETPIGSLHGDT